MSPVDAEPRCRGSDEPVPDMNVQIERTTSTWIARLVVFAWCLIPARGDVLGNCPVLYRRGLNAENAPPPLGSRNTALLAVAVADAVDAIGHRAQITLALAVINRLDLPDKVRLFALVQVASADVTIAGWDAKYLYNSWRPVTAINALKIGASSDGSESIWEPLLPTPAHPGYVSGHSTFSGAAAEVLRRSC